MAHAASHFKFIDLHFTVAGSFISGIVIIVTEINWHLLPRKISEIIRGPI